MTQVMAGVMLLIKNNGSKIEAVGITYIGPAVERDSAIRRTTYER